jgi:hypothetical protein
MARHSHRRQALLAACLLLPLAPSSAALLPRRLGECRPTFIREIHYRLSTADANGVQIPIAGSGSAVSHTNGGYQMSYDTVPAIHSSREGDRVELCLSFVPDCREAPCGGA